MKDQVFQRLPHGCNHARSTFANSIHYYSNPFITRLWNRCRSTVSILSVVASLAQRSLPPIGLVQSVWSDAAESQRPGPVAD